jgi:hypothetical protein
MLDPYETMGLPRDASVAEIRDRYLTLVRQHPPDRDPERFAAIHAAYEALRDPAKRIEERIFSVRVGSDSLEALSADIKRRLFEKRIPVQALLSLADSP